MTSGEGSPAYVRSTEAERSNVGDRVVLYHRVTRKAVVVNPTGVAIWDLLSTARTATEIATAIAETHRSAPVGEVEKDVVDFLRDLGAHQMIVEARS